MPAINRNAPMPLTHAGAAAAHMTALQALQRSVLACLLWEHNFYESGEHIANRIKALIPQVAAPDVAALAIAARQQHHLRHVPLLLVRELVRATQGTAHSTLIAPTLAAVIQRADELSEFLAIYWQEQKQPLTKQVKKGLAQAFQSFDAYQLGKYNRDNPIKLRDVLFLVHAKPKDAAQAEVWRQLASNSLATPDTWEKRLSAGENKHAVFTQLLQTKQLGYLAALRNLRNMAQAGVDKSLVADYLLTHPGIRQILPFRFLAAARAMPTWANILEAPMLNAIQHAPQLTGKTLILIDRSASMMAHLSAKADLNRGDAAAALVILLRELCESVEIWWFTAPGYAEEWLAPVKPRRGFALAKLLQPLQAGTNLGAAVSHLLARPYERLIVLTDEQSSTPVAQPTHGSNYMINVAAHKNGVGYGNWLHIDGFSEAVIHYIQALEDLT